MASFFTALEITGLTGSIRLMVAAMDDATATFRQMDDVIYASCNDGFQPPAVSPMLPTLSAPPMPPALSTPPIFPELQIDDDLIIDVPYVELASEDIEEEHENLQKVKKDASEISEEMKEVKKETEETKKSTGLLEAAYKKVSGVVKKFFPNMTYENMAKEAVSYASNLSGVEHVINTTFGENSARIDEWAQTTLSSFGLSELSAKQFVSTMGSMLSGSGLSNDAMTDMSMGVAQLAGDMASFYQMKPEEAFNQLQNAISGSSGALSQYGIDLSQEKLENFSKSQGIEMPYMDMSQAEQTMLRYQYLMQCMGYAQGDFANNSGSYANQTQLLHESWSSFIGDIGTAVLPLLATLTQYINNAIAAIRPYIPQIVGIVSVIVDVIGGIIDAAITVGSVIVDNWSKIVPLVIGIISVLGVYAFVLGIISAYKAVFSIIQAIQAITTKANTTAIEEETVAQEALNTTMAANPIVWVIGLILLLIFIISLIVAKINEVCGTSYSVVGMIAGAIMWLVALIVNLVIGTINMILQHVWRFITPFLGIIEFVINAIHGGFTSLGGAIANLLGQIISWALDVFKIASKIIDAVFGSSLTDKLNGLQDKVLSWGKNEDAITIDRKAPEIDYRMDMTDSFDMGYNFGSKLENKFTNFFNAGELPEIENPYDKDLFEADSFETDSTTQTLEGIGKDTSSIADSVDISNENLEYMRDLAEKEAINRFTTAKIQVDMTNHNKVSADTDLDGMIRYLSEGVSHALSQAAEGVHA